MFKSVIDFIKGQFPGQDFIPLHEPRFVGNEKAYLLDCIDSTFVSSVGEYVNRFEKMMAKASGAKHAVAIVNGTNALHVALVVSGVKAGDEVVTQALTFIATANAISYCNANPIFVDVSMSTLGMCPERLLVFLMENAERKSDGYTYNKHTGRRIKACVPMHTFGFPCEIDKLAVICKDWNIELIEDAAESLGSCYKGNHTGVFGKMGVFSFNGNKTVTAGGGGAIVTSDATIAKKIKHLTTQAKVQHRWDFKHDHIGYNYRMPNINAALLCAQMEQLSCYIENKRDLASAYSDFFDTTERLTYFKEQEGMKANYWLNVLICEDKTHRDQFLQETNDNGVMTRPSWELMHRLKMFEKAAKGVLSNSEWLADRLVNIPSSVRLEDGQIKRKKDVS